MAVGGRGSRPERDLGRTRLEGERAAALLLVVVEEAVRGFGVGVDVEAEGLRRPLGLDGEVEEGGRRSAGDVEVTGSGSLGIVGVLSRRI